jgi:hypothetical protein
MSKRRNVTKRIRRRRYGGNNGTLGNTVGTGVNNITSTADSAAGKIVGAVRGTGEYLSNTASGIAGNIGSTAHQGATMFNRTVDNSINTINDTVSDVRQQLQNTFTPNTTGGVMMNSNPNMSLYNQTEEEEEEKKPWWKFWGGRRRKTKKRNNKRRKTKSHKRKGKKSRRKVNKRRSNKRGGAKVPDHGRGHHTPRYASNLQGLSPSEHNSKLTMSRVRPDGLVGGSRKRRGQRYEKRMKGGRGPPQPLMPQDLVNAYRGVIGASENAINTWQGRPQNISVNPYPTKQMVHGQDIKVLGRKYPDISANYDTATSTVASL